MNNTGPWQHNPWYSFLRHYVDYTTRYSYRRCKVEGKENIPSNAAVIVAPNHCNTLMDAMVVLRTFRGPIVFGARADIFENRTVAKILRFLRILPMVRRRDGIRKVLRNYDTMDQVVDVLSNGVPFCMFAEGAHRPKHSLMPLSKGIFRIALSADQALDGKKDVYIVPAGLEYGSYFRYRSWSRVRYGRPVNVSQFVREHPDLSDPEKYNALRELLAPAIRSQFVWFPDDEEYDARWNAFEERFNALRGCKPSEAGLPKSRIGRVLLAVLTSPFFLVSAVITAPMWGIAEYLCHCKVRDRAFRNTVRFGVKLIVTILLGIIYGVLLFVFLPWWIALLGLLYFVVSYSIVYDWLNLVRK